MRYVIILLAITIAFIFSMPVIAQNPIQLYYFERIPYAAESDQGEVTGLCATPAAEAFKKAGIPFQWKKMPFKRQQVTIKHNKKRACGIGWFKNPEREKFARYTDAIYQDKPAITISRKGNVALKQHSILQNLIKDKNVKLLVKDGFSYGAYIDGLIDKYDPAVVVATSTNVQMLQMLLAGRADYFFSSEEEAEHMIKSAGYGVSQFQLQHYNDMPPGNRRYITCSQKVSPETIDLLNRALK
jgi:uncharacterized protein (TIGR02285 family)